MMRIVRCPAPQRGVAFLLAAIALPASGQIASSQGGEILEEIIVTGSRIARDPNLGGALPVQSITADDIRASASLRSRM